MPLSVCIPTYHGLDLIDETLATILAQNYRDFEVVICNDSPDDHNAMSAKMASYGDPRLRFFTNEVNLGYPGNIRRCMELATHDILFLMGQDDLLLGDDLFTRIMEVLASHPEIGCIARPYYWFESDPHKPVRVEPKHPTRVIDIRTDPNEFLAVFRTSSQLSALVYRRHLITAPVHDHVFTAHVYPFLSILKTHSCYFWPEFNLAVRTVSSQCRSVSGIYHPAPTRTWAELFRTLFSEPEFAEVRRMGLQIMSRNFVGLVQIRNYGYMRDYFADAWWLVKLRPWNLFDPRFWAFFIGCACTPRFLLRRLSDGYKRHFLGSRLRHILDGAPDVAGHGRPQAAQTER